MSLVLISYTQYTQREVLTHQLSIEQLPHKQTHTATTATSKECRDSILPILSLTMMSSLQGNASNRLSLKIVSFTVNYECFSASTHCLLFLGRHAVPSRIGSSTENNFVTATRVRCIRNVAVSKLTWSRDVWACALVEAHVIQRCVGVCFCGSVACSNKKFSQW